MNGPSHYREAERLLNLADAGRDMLSVEGQTYLVVRAQVHATLAQVAVIHDRETGTLQQLREDEWREALGPGDALEGRQGSRRGGVGPSATGSEIGPQNGAGGITPVEDEGDA